MMHLPMWFYCSVTVEDFLFHLAYYPIMMTWLGLIELVMTLSPIRCSRLSWDKRSNVVVSCSDHVLFIEVLSRPLSLLVMAVYVLITEPCSSSLSVFMPVLDMLSLVYKRIVHGIL